ncbi:hypothetical protein [Fonticella tunisiensis]|uniref:NlpC/P60 family protein n=1 Tax=Fonticella tunisiensis TaxID=1096341 RepID=A0A4R7KMF0_9CLOT|nr:hypothetical protein [Fonticella tunisiensis]TDT57284.1 hypothetical protein EDD71_11266 [Fonticella tunisiensis]
MFGRLRLRRPYRRYRNNYLLDFLKAYVVFFILISSAVFLLKLFYKEKHENIKPPAEYAALNKMKRSEAFKRGMDMINYVWEYDVLKNGPKNSSEVELPAFLRGAEVKKVSGIPYAWGGYTALDISNQKYVKNFEESVKSGYTTGNVLCVGGYKEMTAGLDCSGFVSAVFKFKENMGTKGFERAFTRIELEDLKPMDILVSRGNHAMIYLATTSDKSGIIAMESTTGTSYEKPEKTVISYRSWEEIREGINSEPYIAMRYNKIEDDDIEFFKDSNEFNNYAKRAVDITQGKNYTGYIDYVDDVDYFKFAVSGKESLVLSVSTIPEFCRAEVLSQGGNVILGINKKGSYGLNLDKGTYYIKLYGMDFKYSEEKEYEFSLKR